MGLARLTQFLGAGILAAGVGQAATLGVVFVDGLELTHRRELDVVDRKEFFKSEIKSLGHQYIKFQKCLSACEITTQCTATFPVVRQRRPGKFELVTEARVSCRPGIDAHSMSHASLPESSVVACNGHQTQRARRYKGRFWTVEQREGRNHIVTEILFPNLATNKIVDYRESRSAETQQYLFIQKGN